VQFDDCPLKNFLVNESEPGGRLARVRFAPKADKSPHRSEMTRWAKRRHQATENPAILAGALEVEELFGQRQVAGLGDQLAKRLPRPGGRTPGRGVSFSGPDQKLPSSIRKFRVPFGNP
jgi:hypothetical protein